MTKTPPVDDGAHLTSGGAYLPVRFSGSAGPQSPGGLDRKATDCQICKQKSYFVVNQFMNNKQYLTGGC